MGVTLRPVHQLICLLLFCFCVGVALSSPSPPQAGQRDFRNRHHARNVPNLLLSSRQVNPDSLRGGASRRQSCPTPQVSGGCCPAGKSVCGTICTDTSTDIENCGTCGATCINGFCGGGMCECGAGTLLCDGACIACPAHSVCGSDGQCACNNAAGYYSCDNICNNYQTDNANCGTCGATCTNGFCGGGMCECGAGTLLCDGACIACPQHSVCGSDGQCACNNAAGYYSCDNACNNYQSDIDNCGFCGNVCSSGSCNGGTCCPTNEPNICNSACTNLATDPLNCGQCGHACGAHQICAGSSCQTCTITGSQSCSNTCVALADPSNCGSCGNVCGSGATCKLEVLFGTFACVSCAPGASACGNSCLFLGDDPANCGSCGHACGADQICSGSSCYTCAPGLQPCSNVCVSTQLSANCGACGAACGNDQICSSVHGNVGCVTCPTGTEPCGNECISLADSGNCGACGNACASGQDCITLLGGPGVSSSYVCNLPDAQCEGLIQVWGNGNFYGYLHSVGYNGSPDTGVYTWNTQGIIFSIECAGGTGLDITSLNPVDTTYIYACAAESDGETGMEVFLMTGCKAETGVGSEPTEDGTEVYGGRLAETAIWNMDPSTFVITASWIDGSGSSPSTYIVDLGDTGVYLTTNLASPGSHGPGYPIILTLIFGAGP